MPLHLQSNHGFRNERIRDELQRLQAAHPDVVRSGVRLRDLTSFHIGGPALAVCAIHTPAQAQRFQAFAAEHGLPITCLGGGSNVLAADQGFCGLIFKMQIATFAVCGEAVTVGAGVWFDDMIARTLGSGLVGLEFASGIPGSVGGAVIGNAGCYGHEISEFIEQVTLLRPDGRIEIVDPQQLGFDYRTSLLKQTGDMVLEVVLRLRKGDTAPAEDVRREKIALRRQKHPVGEPCAGSYFKNLPPDRPGGRRRAAGELLDRAGAKALRVGDAGVFAKHANIIINCGQATSADVLGLAALMRGAVREQFGVELQEEVRYLPFDPDA